MSKRLQFPLQNRLQAVAMAAILLAVHPSVSAQQAPEEDSPQRGDIREMGPPPDFVPPPPPDFSPPTLPPAARQAPGAVSPADNAENAATPRPRRTIPSQEELFDRPSDLVDQTDPAMQEVVGLIRIPDMGTNEVLEMLENFTRKPILRQQTLPSVKITFFSQDPLTRGEAIRAIESLLALNGIAITSMGEKFLKAVPSAIVNAQVARRWEGTTLDAEPSQTIYEKLFELDFLSTQEATALIQPLMTQGAPIAFDKSNLILVTDSLINLQRIERLLPVLDKPAKLRTEMLFFELQNIEATDVVRRMEQLIQGPLSRQLQNNTSVDGDERTNQIIVFTHPTNARLITNLINRLDIDVAPTTATKVYSIRYADATELVNIIDQIVSGQRQVRQETGGSDAAAQAAARQRAAQLRQINQAAAAARSEASNLQFSDFLTIVPDERANTIVASGTPNDLRYLEQLIEEIDTLLAQVRIEVVVAEVSLGEDDVRGISSLGFGYSGTGFDIDLEGDESTWAVTPGEMYGVTFGDGIQWNQGVFSFDVILNAIANNSNAQVLSAPTIVTTHNKEAKVSVGQEQPVITGTTTSDLSSGPSTREQVQYRDIKLELTVTPLIGADGVVQMEIEQQIESIIDTVQVNDNDQPVIGTRSANSYVSVRDGGLIALGGLQEFNTRRSKARMAILGKLPVIGDLFTRNFEERERTELLIFIRPNIIRTADDANSDASSLIDVLEGSREIRDYLEQGTFRPQEEEEPGQEREIPRRNKP